MAFSFKCMVATHIGNRRKNNEDNFFIGEILTHEEQAAMSQTKNRLAMKNLIADNTVNKIFAVSDGMGGHKYGEMASLIAVETINNFTNSHKEKSQYKSNT